ncbi:MAG: carboxylating nicotinate-nucleotide diphosphorylase [Myxococcota bacterium]
MLLTPHVQALIDMALNEDLGGGDATTDAIFPGHQLCTATVLAKSDLVLCGLEIFEAVMRRVDSELTCTWNVDDGAQVAQMTPLGRVQGRVRSILKAERTALNFIQRMSGVATQTYAYAKHVEGTQTVVVDTRKTLPGWRTLDKYAVRCGGGRNHRLNLGAGVMIKDNHIEAAGSITEAVRRVREVAAHTLRIEVEVVNMEQLEEAVHAGVEIILLDNMSTPEVRAAVERARTLAAGRPLLLEASGGITAPRLVELAQAGVDIISVGALTHSVSAADISLDVDTVSTTI